MKVIAAIQCWFRTRFGLPVVDWQCVYDTPIPQVCFRIDRVFVDMQAVGKSCEGEFTFGLERNARKDWGEVHPLVAAANDIAARFRGKSTARYPLRGDRFFMVVTDFKTRVSTIWLE